MALKIQSRPPMRYAFSLGTSFAKVGRLGTENNCCKQTARHNANLYMDVYLLMTPNVSLTLFFIQVSCLAVHESLVLMAVGYNNGYVQVFKGDVTRDR